MGYLRRPRLNNESKVIFILFLSTSKKGNRGIQNLNNSLRASLSVSQPYYRNGTFSFTVLWDSLFSCLELFKNVFLPYPFCHPYTSIGLFIYFFILECLVSVLSLYTWNLPDRGSHWVESLCRFYSSRRNLCCLDFLESAIARDFSLLCLFIGQSHFFSCVLPLSLQKSFCKICLPHQSQYSTVSVCSLYGNWDTCHNAKITGATIRVGKSAHALLWHHRSFPIETRFRYFFYFHM